MKKVFLQIARAVFVFFDAEPIKRPIISPATFQQLIMDGIFDINPN
jgi:hypothetical protein